MQRKISLTKEGAHGDELLVLINGTTSICPYQPALCFPSQNNFGQVNMQITRMPCTTSCPLCSVVGKTISFNCGKGTLENLIDEQTTENKSPKIINI